MGNRKMMLWLLGVAGCMVTGVAFAEPIGGGGAGGCVISATGDMTGGVMCQFRAAATRINDQLIQPAIKTAIAAVMLQWVLSYWKDLFKPDLTDILLKGAGLITWLGATMLLINNMDRMSAMFTEYLALAGSLSSLNATQFSPGGVIDKSMDTISATNKAFNGATPGGLLDVAANMFAALMLMFANIFTFLAGLTVALSLFVAILEFWIMFAVAPLAFGLIPLSTFRDQGFAPIKGVISLGLRLLILGVVVAVFSELTRVVIQAMNSKSGVGDATTLMGAVWYYLAGMAGCAMMALSAGKIASSIASGSASFSGSDAIRGGMQLTTTAAAGAGAIMAGKALLANAGGGAANAFSSGAAKQGGAYDAGRSMGGAMGNALGGPGLGVSPSASGFGQPLQNRPGAGSLGGGTAPPSSGASQPAQAGNVAPPSSGASQPAQAGNVAPPSSGASQPAQAGNVAPPSSGASNSPITEAAPAASAPSSGVDTVGNASSLGSGDKPSGGSGFGQSLQSRSDAAPVGGGSSTEPSSLASPATSGLSGGADVAGNASSAGIGGPVGDKSSWLDGRQRMFGEKIKGVADRNAQDSHAVSIQMHVGKD